MGELVLADQDELARYVRHDELHLAFNFTLLFEDWEAGAMQTTIERTRTALDSVGATPSWVLENHDVERLPTRYGGGEQGRRRARAAALLLLALPGSACLYAGQELGLEDVDVPDELRQDPIFFRTNGRRSGRDGCRVPIPWTGEAPGFGFSTGSPWLPMPDQWAGVSVAAQEGDPSSTLDLYRRALGVRRTSAALQNGSFAWLASRPGSLVFARTAGEETLVCAVNVDADGFEPPAGKLVLASEPPLGAGIPRGSAAWVLLTKSVS